MCLARAQQAPVRRCARVPLCVKTSIKRSIGDCIRARLPDKASGPATRIIARAAFTDCRVEGAATVSETPAPLPHGAGLFLCASRVLLVRGARQTHYFGERDRKLTCPLVAVLGFESVRAIS